MDISLRQSKLRPQMTWLRFSGRIFRRLIYETAMDTTTGLAAQMAYQFLFTLAPGLLFLWHLLSLFGTDPAKLHQMINVLKNFLPADPKVQEIIDSLVANIVVTGSSGTLANVGIFFGLWLGTVFISTRLTSHGTGTAAGSWTARPRRRACTRTCSSAMSAACCSPSSRRRPSWRSPSKKARPPSR